MSEQNCNQCENHCPADALRCNRGRVHFGMEPVEKKMPDGPVGLLQKCGFVLHHGNIDPEEALCALTEQEQAQLERLLSALLTDWQNRMPQAFPKHGHGRGHH